MIEKTAAYKTSDNITHPTLAAAQAHEIESLLGKLEGTATIGERLVANSEAVVDILTTKSGSKPRARRINGGTKKRTPKTEHPTEAK